MSDIVTISADKRDRAGKGSARAARREGLIPAVIYGDHKTPLSILLNANSFTKLINLPGIMSQLMTIKVDGKHHSVLPRDIQFHPVSGVPLHVDFLRISKDTMVAVMVPVNFINEDKSPGLKTGGILNIVRYEVELTCPADSIPDSITVDLEGANTGDSIHVSAVTLPTGVVPTITDRDFTIATIAAPSTESDDTVESSDDGDAEQDTTSENE